MQNLVNIDGYGTFSHFKRVKKYVLLTKLDQHVNEMMTTAGKEVSEFFMVPFSYNRAKR